MELVAPAPTASMIVTMPSMVTYPAETGGTIQLPADATGTVGVNIDGMDIENLSLTAGVANFGYRLDVCSSYTFTFSYSGDAKYPGTTVTKEVQVAKGNSSIIGLDVDDIIYPAKALIHVEVTSGATGEVSCRVYNGETSQTFSGTLQVYEGRSMVTIDALGLAVGTYNVEATYLGDENYNPSSPTTTQFSVNSYNP